MFGFPINSGGSGFESLQEKFTNNADSGFPKIQQREVFYTMRDGTYESMQWVTASGRVGLIPSANDDVYIRHNVNIGFTTPILNNLIISQNAIFSATNPNLFLRCNRFINYGTFSAVSASGFRLELYGDGHYFGNSLFSFAGINSVQYLGTVEQIIEPITYPSLFLSNGNKILKSDLVVTNGFFLQNNGILNLRGYNLTCLSTAAIGGTNTRFIVSESSKILFVGNVTFDGGPIPTLYFEGNVDIEFRNGVSFNYWTNGAALVSGTGTWRFTTNNQSISTINSSQVNLNCKIAIADGITLTNGASSTLNLYNEFTGEGPGSVFVNRGIVNFPVQFSADNFMNTGIYDITTNANTIGFVGNISMTIPSKFTNLYNLSISGTGTKTLSVNTAIVNNLVVSGQNNGIFDALNYSVNIGGQLQTTGSTSNNATITRSIASSNIPFVAGSYAVPGATGNITINLGANNDIEFTGTGTYTWSQTSITCRKIIFNANVTITMNQSATWTCDAYIKSGVTVTQGGTAVISHNGNLIGDNITSVYVVSSTATYNLLTNVPLLPLGTFTNNGSIYYSFNGNRTIDFTTFVDLSVSGTGVKTLSGDTLVTRNLLGSAGLELSSFNLTINNELRAGGMSITRTPASTGKILKFGTFIAGASGGTINVGPTNNIEMTGTTFQLNQNTFTCNQFIISNNVVAGTQAQSLTIVGELFIKTGFSFTFNQNTTLTLNGLNGEAATSSFIATAGTISYRGATQPMLTGILNLSGGLNTFIYSNGNQNIKGGPTTLAKQVYRNLTLNGGGTKTLQGYVSVQNTYTLTAPATLALNGYTLTNP